MTTIYLGSRSLGESIPGLQEALAAAGEGLRLARTAADSAIGQLDAVAGAIQGVAGEIESAKDGLISTAVAPALAAVATAQGLLGELSALGNPGDYMSGVLAGIDSARALLAGLVPANYLADAVNAVSSAVSNLQSEALGYVGLGDSLTDITGQVAGVLANVGTVTNALRDANAATLGAMVAYSEMLSALLNSGVHAFAYTGALSAVGSELDTATPATGVGGSAEIGGVILFAKTADSATLAALQSVFGI